MLKIFMKFNILKKKITFSNGKEFFLFKKNFYSFIVKQKRKKMFYEKNINNEIKKEIEKKINKYDYELYLNYMNKFINLTDVNDNFIKMKEEIDIVQYLFSVLRESSELKDIHNELSENIIIQIAQCIITCYKTSYEDKEDYFYVPITMIVKYIYTYLIDIYNINKTHEIIKKIIIII